MEERSKSSQLEAKISSMNKFSHSSIHEKLKTRLLTTSSNLALDEEKEKEKACEKEKEGSWLNTPPQSPDSSTPVKKLRKCSLSPTRDNNVSNSSNTRAFGDKDNLGVENKHQSCNNNDNINSSGDEPEDENDLARRQNDDQSDTSHSKDLMALWSPKSKPVKKNRNRRESSIFHFSAMNNSSSNNTRDAMLRDNEMEERQYFDEMMAQEENISPPQKRPPTDVLKFNDDSSPCKINEDDRLFQKVNTVDLDLKSSMNQNWAEGSYSTNDVCMNVDDY